MNPKYEKEKFAEGYTHVIGCDEVGRGCLAGPVVAAAVVLDFRFRTEDLNDVRDSKLLTPKLRGRLSEVIKERSGWGIGVAEKEEIDEINIHHASLLAMKRAVENLYSTSLETILKERKRLKGDSGRVLLAVDGKFEVPKLNIEQEAIVDGDAKVLSIAAASIVAKVYRDNLMRVLHMKFPEYNFAQHKGYATAKHKKVIAKIGLSPHHRLTFCQQYIKT